jgi:RNase H-like domain found in reverse transcriptase
MKKDKKFEWTMDCQDAFNTMKKQFTEELVLLMPDQSKPFQIKSDTSKVATRAVLTQLDSVGDALDKLRSLRKKKMELINEHIAKFKMLAAESKIDTTNPLSIELFKKTLPWALMLQLMRLETLLKTIDDWYKWAASLNH